MKKGLLKEEEFRQLMKDGENGSRSLFDLANVVLHNDLSEQQIEEIKNFLFTHDEGGENIFTFAESLKKKGIDFDIEEFRKELKETIWEDYLNDLEKYDTDFSMER